MQNQNNRRRPGRAQAYAKNAETQEMEAVDTFFRLCYNPITDYPVCFLRFIKQTLNYEVI